MRTTTTGRRTVMALTTATLALAGTLATTSAAFTDDTTAAGNTATTATLEGITPQQTPGTPAGTIGLDWPAAPTGGLAPEYSLTRTGPGDTADVYTGPDTSTTDPGRIPAELRDLDITAIDAGGNHTCAIADGTAYCWGTNGSGQLGTGDDTDRRNPVEVTGGSLAGRTVTAITVGGGYTCAIADGTVYCWGANGSGQLGTGSTSNQPTTVPMAVTGGSLAGQTVATITTGFDHTCATTSDGTAHCWGFNSSGQLGDGTTTGHLRPVAVAVTGGSSLAGQRATAITAGLDHTCATTSDGTAHCWGSNSSGRLGDGTTTGRLRPVAVAATAGSSLANRTVSTITASGAHTCATTTGGTAHCWGSNSFGRLGDGTTTNRLLPVAVTGGTLQGLTVTTITAGSGYTCATAGGRAHCWGANFSGRLGDGTTTNRLLPFAVTGGSLQGRTVTTITAGSGSHTCATTGGTAHCWGNNGSGQLGTGTAGGTEQEPVLIRGPQRLLCPEGSDRIGTTSACTLVPGQGYTYELSYTIGNWTAPPRSITVTAP